MYNEQVLWYRACFFVVDNILGTVYNLGNRRDFI